VNSFTAKRLRVTLIMSGTNSVFPGTNSNTLILDNLRVSAKVQQVARLATQADIKIFGMKAADMNALTITWAKPPIVLDHLVILEADNGKGFVQIFRGTITEAQPNYQGAPDVFFGLVATTGYFQKINPVEPTSYPAATDIKVVAEDLCKRMGFVFVDGGATATFAEGSYFWGTLWDQFVQACQAANADFYVQNDRIIVTNAGKPGKDKPAVILSPESGLIGYPQYERAGLLVLAIFDPAFTCGVPIEIEGNVPNANGRWYPYSMMHILESRVPRGQWMSQLQCLQVIA
jgi:hypothetical protein